MKIAIVTPTFPPYSGGIGTVAAEHARLLKAAGQDVTVFTPLYGPVTEEATDVTVKRIKPLFKYGNAAYVPALKKMLVGFDIVHLHYPFFGGAEVVSRAMSRLRKKYRTKLVLHYHMDVVGQGMLRHLFAAHRRLLLPRVLRRADQVIVTSLDYAKGSFLSQWIAAHPDRVTEIPNGIDTTRFSPLSPSEALRERHGITPDERVILFVGGLDRAHYFKGVEYLIEAASRLRQESYHPRLVIVGSGELEAQYRSLAVQLNFDAHVVFAGKVKNAELAAYYQLADVVVLPSVDASEAFGIVLVEAMACARPVVASNLPGVRTVVDDTVNGFLVEPRDVDGLARRLHTILADPTLGAELGRAGLHKARQRYDWNVLIETLLKLYSSL